MRAPSTQEDEGRYEIIKQCSSDKEADELIERLNRDNYYYRYCKAKPQREFE